jgi:chorismate lyase/3-hydroxybenzoate synthase
MISFDKTTFVNPSDPRQLVVGLPELGTSRTVEAWLSREAVETGREAKLSFSKNAQLLFAHIFIESPSIEEATYQAYHEILTFIQRQGYPYLLRVWNYFPSITKIDKLERYQAFCVGRYESLKDLDHFEEILPAASAIGTKAAGLLIYFIAAKAPGVQIENPRQISAFHYPRQYSPKSPSFSRAILKHWGTASHLYISGTASIVGHETRYEYDINDQLQETLKNIEALLMHTNVGLQGLKDISLFKVYLRDHRHFEAIKQQMKKIIGSQVPILFLQGDICRQNLLLEIEGLVQG